MTAQVTYYIWATLLILFCSISWATIVFSLPGNWVMAGAAALVAWVVPEGPAGGISWTTVTILVILAALGEIVESFAGAANVAKLGGSRRSAVLSLLGTIMGSIGGVIVGLPVPVIGPAIAALAGGAIGAFCGAAAGEFWKGRTLDQQVEVGRAAFWGRIMGTFGKLAMGIAMIVITAADAFF